MPMRALRITGADVPVIASREAAIEACSAIETTMESLLQLIEAESVLLRAGKTLAAAALVQRENEFAAAYIDDLRLLREIGPDLEQFAPDAVDRLRRLHEEFVAVLQIDMAALAAARAAAVDPILSSRGPADRAALSDARMTPRQDRVGRHVPQRLAASSRR